ncbi:endospore germination permease [Paenibacillus puldeungensis]|uniref:Endospore germination permease n=1 Tax=Paenibacillus puldeungensis TaxID=696536 RepID=A0ABW3RX30_9BACL
MQVLEKEKISALQLGLMMCPAVLASGFLVLPTATAQYAQNDLWLTSVLATLVGFISVVMATRLHQYYPNLTVIQYSERIVGKLLGKIIGLIFIINNFIPSSLITRQYADFVTGNFLLRTPILLIMASMVLLCTITVRGGVEILGRITSIFLPLFVVPILFLLFLFPDLDLKAIFPVMSQGIVPVVKGSIPMMGWCNELFIMSFFLPSVTDPERGRKWGFVSLGVIILFLTFTNLIGLFLLGPDLGNKVYPILIAFRYVSVGAFLENLESLLLAMWVIGHFLQISIYFYITALSVAQWFQLKDYRPIVFPLSLLVLINGVWGLPNFSVLSDIIRYTIPFFILTTNLLIPLLLLIVAAVRNRKTKDRMNL